MTLMSTKEVAGMTGLSEATLRYFRSTDQGPRSFKLGRVVKYKQADVEAWIEQQIETTARGGNKETA